MMAEGVGQTVDDPGCIQGEDVPAHVSEESEPPGFQINVTNDQSRDNKTKHCLQQNEMPGK